MNKSIEMVNNIASTLSLQDFDLTFETVKRVAPEGFSVIVRKFLQNWRQGTAACKNRRMVTGSNKKPWQQKGTGRARSGDNKSPLWRGGGVVFGPQPRVRNLKIPRAMRQNILGALIGNALETGSFYISNWALQGEVPSTKQAHTLLVQAGIANRRVNVLLPQYDFVTAASFANIPSVRILFFDSINAYDLADASAWLIFEKDRTQFKEMVTQWI
jgi:large subunit ribosomal protein L4